MLHAGYADALRGAIVVAGACVVLDKGSVRSQQLLLLMHEESFSALTNALGGASLPFTPKSGF